jgi:hypothetical protein
MTFGDLQWHIVHKTFRENRQVVSNARRVTYGHKNGQYDDFLRAN